MALQTATVLGNVASGGLIREDVMEKIWDISSIPLPLSDRLGAASEAINSYHEWTEDSLAAPSTSNAVLDGADRSGDNNKSGSRVGNHCQISVKYVTVSTRARRVKTIGRADELSYQVMMRQRELRRDKEAIMLTQQASRADNGTLAGLSAGYGAWLTTNTDRGVGASDGGFSSGVVSAPTVGTTRGLTETRVRDMVESIYTQGGDPSIMMSSPKLIRNFSNYLFTSSARVATIQSDQGKSAEKATALGAVNIFVTDFGTLELVSNRIYQPTVATPGSRNVEVCIMDPMYLGHAQLSGFVTEPLAKTGLSDVRQMYTDWCFELKSEPSQGIIADIDDEVAVAFS